jgi:hypothetical protein
VEKLAFILGIGFSNDKKILIALPHGKRCIRSQELVAEDLGRDDVVGLVLGFELVAADGAVSASQVAWFPGLVEGAEGVKLLGR